MSLMMTETKRAIFFSAVTTGKLPMLPYIHPYSSTMYWLLIDSKKKLWKLQLYHHKTTTVISKFMFGLKTKTDKHVHEKVICGGRTQRQGRQDMGEDGRRER